MADKMKYSLSLLGVISALFLTPSASAQSLEERGISPTDLGAHVARTVSRTMSEAHINMIVTAGSAKGKYGYIVQTNSYKENMITQTAPRRNFGTRYLSNGPTISKFYDGRKELPPPFTNLDDFWMEAPILGTELAYGLFISPFPQCELADTQKDFYRLVCQDIRVSDKYNWTKVYVDVDHSRLLPLKALYVDEGDQVQRIVTFSDFKQLANRTSPSKITYINGRKKNEKVILTITDLASNEAYFGEQFDITAPVSKKR